MKDLYTYHHVVQHTSLNGGMCTTIWPTSDHANKYTLLYRFCLHCSIHFASVSLTIIFDPETGTYTLNFQFLNNNTNGNYMRFLRDSCLVVPATVYMGNGAHQIHSVSRGCVISLNLVTVTSQTSCDQLQNVTFTSLDPGSQYFCGVRCKSVIIVRSIARKLTTRIEDCVPLLIMQ